MDEAQNNGRPVNPRRRKRTKLEIFKETYLPAVIAGVALLFILVTVVGAIVQGVQRKIIADEQAKQAAIAAEEEAARLDAEAAELLLKATAYGSSHNYDLAIETIQSFSGNVADQPKLVNALQIYTKTKNNLVAWDDPAQVINLSFQLLIADPIRAFVAPVYGNAYNRNFVTVDEFRLILDQLYKNGYVLVDLMDIVEQTQNGDSVTYSPKTVYLPEGKKPLMLTQTHVNYNTFMVDGPDQDRLPDKDGAGFASKLILDSNGNLINEMVDRDGNTVQGEYDLIPILNSFIAEHPDFSYRGAKAIIAVTGYDGLFGYRTNPGAKSWLGEEGYAQEIENAKIIANAIRDDGYRIACYTYENIGYGDSSYSGVKYDLDRWNNEVVPILGSIDILAFAQISDIAGHTPYSGDKFKLLQDSGFRYYLGFCQNGAPWASAEQDYFRQARILVTGSNMKYQSQWFTDIFDPVQVLSSTRGTIPR